MLIHVAVATGTAKSLVRRDELLAMHARSSSGLHQLTEDPRAADLIVLAGEIESLAEAQANPLLRQFPEKTFTYSEIDRLPFWVPGVYGSGGKPGPINLHRVQSNIYFSRYGSSKNTEIRHRPNEPKHLLFCFRGRKDCRVRADLINHPWNRPDIEVLEANAYMHWKKGNVGQNTSQKDYADALAHSHFALCPRGMGFGSIRLFEVMEMGIAPVLLADLYALPPGPDWQKFLIHIPERDFAKLPQILEARKADSTEMGRLAREAWEQFFHPDIVFDRVIDQLIEIRRRRVLPERLYRQLWPLIDLRQHARARLGNLIRRTISGTPTKTPASHES